MSKKVNMEKFKRYSHNLKIVMNVFYWASIVVAFAAIAAAVVIALMPDTNFMLKLGDSGNTGFSLDGLVRYSLSGKAVEGISMRIVYITIMIMSSIIAGLIAPALKQIALILGTVEENRPFAVENAKRISIVGIVAIMGSFVVPAVEFIVASVMVNTLKLQSITINYSIDIGLIITGFLLLVLGGVFKYGNYLQKEYDATV